MLIMVVLNNETNQVLLATWAGLGNDKKHNKTRVHCLAGIHNLVVRKWCDA